MMASPLLNNMLTMGASLTVGDVVCQCIQMRDTTEGPSSPSDQEFDLARTARMGFAGFAVQGPLIHWMYSKADVLFGTKPGLGTVLRKVAFASAFAPVHISALFGAVILLSGKTAAEATDKVVNDMPKAYMMG